MKSSKPITGSLPLAFLVFAFLILAATSCGAFFPKVDSFLWLNGYHMPFMDRFFTWYTFMGDGTFSVAVAVVFLCLRQRQIAVKIIIGFLLSGLAAQALKKVFRAPRPKALISADIYPYFIDGVTYSGSNSFPSGHTTSAFALATLLCLYTRNRWLQVCYLVLALLVGYSRIYLGQHFLPDVNAGMMIGMVTGTLIFLTSKKLLLFSKTRTGPYLPA